MSNNEPGCARGRVTIEHAVAGHYELRVRQTSGPGLSTEDDPAGRVASVCMSPGELRALRTMIDKMFPEAPSRVGLNLSKPAPPDGALLEPPVETD